MTPPDRITTRLLNGCWSATISLHGLFDPDDYLHAQHAHGFDSEREARDWAEAQISAHGVERTER